MPYCPNCQAEYIDGTVECEDCHVQLEPGSPPGRPAGENEMDQSHLGRGHAIGEALQSWFRVGKSTLGADVKLTRLKTFTGATAQMDADLARNLLQARGIPSILPGENSAGMLPVLEIPLLVAEEDVERAAAVLREYSEGSSPFRVK
jgi:Putative prokaryotic signal transducing protein